MALLGIFVRERLRRFAIFAAFCANFILVVGVGCIIQALPTSDKPGSRNSADSKSFYGEGYFALLGLTALSAIQLGIHTVVIYSNPKLQIENHTENKKLENPYNEEKVKITTGRQSSSSSVTEPETPVPTPVNSIKHKNGQQSTYLYMSL